MICDWSFPFMLFLLSVIYVLMWTHKISINPPLFIEVPVPSQESEWPCICVLEESIVTVSVVFLLHFGIVTTVWFIFFPFYYIYTNYITIMRNVTEKQQKCKMSYFFRILFVMQ